MTQIHDERALAGALHSLSEGAPVEDVDDAIQTAMRSGRRRVLLRRSGAGVAAAAAAVVVSALGFAVIRADAPVTPQPAGGAPSAAFEDIELKCSGGSGVNEGTVDGADAQKSPTQAAERWASGSGFTTRHPDAVPRQLPGSETSALVVFQDRASGEVNAALEFTHGPDGWTLGGLRYC